MRPIPFACPQLPSVSTIETAIGLLRSVTDREVKRHAIVTLLLVLTGAILAGASPVLLKEIVDALQESGAEIPGLISLLVAAYALAQLTARFLSELRNVHFGQMDQAVQSRLSQKVFRHVMDLPLRFHLDRRTGALSQTIANGLTGYRMVLHHCVLTVLAVLVELVAVGSVLILLDRAAFLVIISAAALFYIATFGIGIARVAEPARAFSSAQIHAHAVLTDSVLNYEVVKCFSGERQVVGRFSAAVSDAEERWIRLLRRKMENGVTVAAVFVLSLWVALYVAAQAVQQSTMSVGEFVLINAYLVQIARPFEMLGFAFRDITQGMAFIEKMTEVLSHEPEADHQAQGLSLPLHAPELVFERVSCLYDAGRPVLQDVSFVVPPGKTLGIVGPSGSGKSSIVRLLLHLITPTSGRIFLNGASLSQLSLSAIRNSIAVIPQDIVLFNESIGYNIAFGNRYSSEADIIRAAKLAHIHDFITGLPEGYETLVGERGLKLSGGEKQRIAIARAAIRKPTVFIFDEATASLDPVTEQAILDDLLTATASTTTLIIAHRLSAVIQADEIVVLSAGRIVEQGTHSDLIWRRGRYATLWHAQYAQLERSAAFSV